MPLQIHPAVLHQTTRCPFEFACLVDERYPLCDCLQVINEVTGVIDHQGRACPYGVIFGGGYYCACLTRSAVCDQYGR